MKGNSQLWVRNGCLWFRDGPLFLMYHRPGQLQLWWVYVWPSLVCLALSGMAVWHMHGISCHQKSDGVSKRTWVWRQLALDSNAGAATSLSWELFQPLVSCPKKPGHWLPHRKCLDQGLTSGRCSSKCYLPQNTADGTYKDFISTSPFSLMPAAWSVR